MSSITMTAMITSPKWVPLSFEERWWDRSPESSHYCLTSFTRLRISLGSSWCLAYMVQETSAT